MKDTGITIIPETRQRLAVGHAPGLRPIAPWDMPTLSGAGALRSTANDLLTFLGAVLGYRESALGPAFASMLNTRRPIGDARGTEIGLGWFIYRRNGAEIIGHGGDTVGFQAAIAFDPKARAGVVVLSNSSTYHQVADIGMHLLDPGYSLDRPEPVEKPIEPALFDRHAGLYELQREPKLLLRFTREGDRFFVETNGEAKTEVFAEGPLNFFLKAIPAQITFQTSGQGRTIGLILHQNGFDETAVRID
jgi:CubicO group peptidase (beta-lactamase class C family)